MRYPTALPGGRRGCAFEQSVQDRDGGRLRISGTLSVEEPKTVAGVVGGTILDVVGALVRSPQDSAQRLGERASSLHEMVKPPPVRVDGDELVRVALQRHGAYLDGKVTLPDGVGQLELRGVPWTDFVRLGFRRAGGRGG